MLRLLWRSGALFLVPLTLALEVPTYLESGHLLGRNWPSTTEVANGSAVLFVITSAVAACALSLNWQRHQPMVDSLPPRGAWFLLTPAVLVWAVTTLTHATWVVFVLLVEWSGTTGPFQFTPFLPVVSAIAAGSFLGALAARYWASWLTPPAVGVVLYLCLINLSGTRYGNLLDFAGIGVPLVGIRPRPELAVSQAAWFTAVALGVALVVVAHSRPPLRRAVAWVVAAAAVAAGGAGVVNQGPDRFELADISWVCRGEAPTVCSLPEYEQALDQVAPRVAEADSRWRALGATAHPPQTYRQRLEMTAPGLPGAPIRVAASMSDEEVAMEVVSASYPCSEDWSYEQFTRAEQVAAALAHGGLAHRGRPAGDLAGIRAVSEALQC